jgi:hypothetical protein
MEEKRKSLVKIVKFKNEDAQKLAELFNSFDREGLWPGGFTKGIPFTGERVLNTFPAGVRNICILISTCDGMFTGVCSLHPHFEDSEAAYIGVFGVHPDYLGKRALDHRHYGFQKAEKQENGCRQNRGVFPFPVGLVSFHHVETALAEFFHQW